ncbi:baseplate J/gp47 family protein [Ralstonia flaminis]|jgi:hypothetical protein|uniref:Baseplate protein J-like domain-containing protein n=1 Tax=Ralstonia flaminis TaxID=3058597 RepID=A0ABM9KAA8_9RALS|nr:baseplate J/gp47 family protein [Ralstonia sp. LMG 18101]CAJ0819071.1 hypothetical protein LMG18101_03824 [Ralstonia sp. LMG 18101]
MGYGTRQDQRLADALRPGYVLPDELSLAQRLALTLAQAGDLRFSEGGEQGTGGHWDNVLRRDEAIVLAELAAFPLERLQQEFLAALEREGEAALWQRVWRLVRSFDGWCQQLSDAGPEAARALGQALLTQLEQGLAGMLAPGVRAFGHGGGTLHPAWARYTAEAAGVQDLPSGNAPVRRQWLRRSWLALTLAIEKLQPLARAALDESLKSGRHDPAMGLLLAAHALVQYSRAPLNRFPERLIDFYYRDVLRLQPRAASPDRVFLLLEREPRFDGAVQIETGTQFVGGKDDAGRPIAFAADGPLEVTDTRVAALYTLRVERNPLISPEREFEYATSVKVEKLPLQAPEAAYAARPAWWPLLGGRARGSASHAQDAQLGIALASPLLRLKEGRREVRIRMQFAHPSDDDGWLQNALRTPASARTPEWLAQVYARYAAFEAQHFPPRPRSGSVASAPDAAALAQAAWQRSPEFEADVQLSFLLAACLACDNAAVFAERLGRLFAVWLVAGEEALRAVDIAALRAHAATLPGQGAGRRVEIDDPLVLIYPPRNHDEAAALPDRALIFGRVFAGVWEARLSTQEGWLTVDKVFICRRSPAGGTSPRGGGIELVVRLGPEEPAVVPCDAAVHGAQWPAQAVLQLGLRTQTRMYAYSMLQQYPLLEINLSVFVHDLRDVVLYNQLGRLDPSRPFQPFGPMPSTGSYLILGSPELACKPLTALQARLRWAGLPTRPGGFTTHYAGYPGDWHTGAFRLRAQVLVDGQWQAGEGEPLPLFAGTDNDMHIAAGQRLRFPATELRRLHRATPPRPSGQPFVFGLSTRNGFFRFDLAEPEGAFGHAAYPTLLAAALTRNARLKRAGALPREPYTPTLESLTVNYQATQDLLLTGDGASGADGLRQGVYHLNAFGVLPVQRNRVGQHPTLLPRHPNDGCLYIGLSGGDPQGALNLFFHLRKEEAAERWIDAPPVLHWSVWREDGWRQLEPHQQLADSTQGLLRSGIVQLNLPAGMRTERGALPEPAYWLRLSADWGFAQLAGLYGVHANAISATRCLQAAAGGNEAGNEAMSEPLPPGVIQAPARSVPGLRRVLQVGPSEGGRPADPPEALRLRGAERLRHKARAITTWDYERLLLDAFPAVYKVKCFAHHQATLGDGNGLQHRRLASLPGHVLLVVVPYPHAGELFSSTEGPRLDAASLDAMRRYIQACAPPGASVLVRNAAYERVQVRCSLQLATGSHPGATLRRLNQALVEYLSPWHTTGLGADFNWRVRGDALEAFLRAQPSVTAVGRLSLLHIIRNDQQFYALHDTAMRANGAGSEMVLPAQPWSLVLPTRQHLLELQDDSRILAPVTTGIDRLEVGGTFIVGRPQPDKPAAGTR